MDGTRQTETKQSEPERESRESVEHDEPMRSTGGLTHPLLQLQQTIGNRAVGQVLRASQGQSVQRRTAASGQAGPQNIQRRENSPSKNKTGLPDNLKSGIENLSGMSMNDVRVHYNSTKPKDLRALAYTKNTDIHLAPGQQKHLPHEAWHVVQQKQGRVTPTMQLKGELLNDDSGLEHEADVMGAKATQGLPKTADTLGKRAPLATIPMASSTGGVVQGKYVHPDGKTPHDADLIRVYAEGYLQSADLTWDQKKKLVDRAIRGPMHQQTGKDYQVSSNNLQKTVENYIDQGIQHGAHNRPYQQNEKFIQPSSKQSLKKQKTLAKMARVPTKPLPQINANLRVNSPVDGIARFGNLLDKAIPDWGSSAGFDVGFTFGLGVTGGIKLEGAAGRGIDGFATSGYPSLAENKKHLEVTTAVTVSVGFGAAIGFAEKGASINLKFLIRAGADNTQAAMNALSYVWYRYLVGNVITKRIGGQRVAKWFYGDAKKAEQWAQSVEKNAFMDAGAFADFGAGLSGNIKAQAKGLAEAELELGFERFNRYDKDRLEELEKTSNLKQDVEDIHAAKSRRKQIKGKSVYAFGFKFATEINVAGAKIGLSGNLSTEHRFRKGKGIKKEEGASFLKDMGLVLTGEIGSEFGDPEKLAIGIIESILLIVRQVKEKVRNQKSSIPEGLIEALEQIVQQYKAPSKQQIEKLKLLLKTFGSSSLLMTLAVGAQPREQTGNKKIKYKPRMRLDIQKQDALELPGSWPITGKVSTVTPLFSLGHEDGQWKFESIGPNRDDLKRLKKKH